MAKQILLFLIFQLIAAIKLTDNEDEPFSIKSLLSSSGEFDQGEFNKILIRKDGLNHILLSDVEKIIKLLGTEFPDIIKVDSIGESWQGRPIHVVSLDATNYFGKGGDDATVQTEDSDNKTANATSDDAAADAALADLQLVQTNEGESPPAILMTGAHHARELITVQMVIYTIFKLIQNGIMNNDKDTVQMLKQNKYYFIPVVNVDGLNFVEETHLTQFSKISVIDKRKNMGPNGEADCPGKLQGVDLNRNYGVDWKVNLAETTAKNPCSEFYPGKKGFTEKETQAMKKFLADHKDELKFVINFHSNGNSFMWPFNGRNPNDIEKRAPGVLSIVQEVAQNANFPPNLKTGNAFDVIEEKVGGDADDYITATYKIPSVTSEIGYASQFVEDWVVKSELIAFDICKLNGYWLEYVFTNLPKFAEELKSKQK